MQQNMSKMLKQAQQMQAKMMKMQDELKAKEVEGTAGGGMVKLTLNGSNDLVSVKINPEVVNPQEVEMLEDLILAAYANASEQIKAMSESAFGAISGGLKIPGL